MEETIPKWFWKFVATCFMGAMLTLLTTAWSLGAFMTETQVWQRAQDERFAAHLVTSTALHEEMVEAIRTVRVTVTDNGRYGAAFKARIDDFSNRLARLEAAQDRKE